MSTIAQRLQEVRRQLPEGVMLVAVSKTYPTTSIEEAYAAGQRVFGENRVQEIVPKYEALPKDIEWHLIGHLQTNKVKYIAPFVHLIHAIDTVKLLEEVNKQAARYNRTIEVLLQVFIAREETKFGFSPDEIRDLFAQGLPATLPNVRIRGLMGMATNTSATQQVADEFAGLAALFQEIKPLAGPAADTLSMGMSGDWQLAVSAGSSMIRIGSAIFGERL